MKVSTAIFRRSMIVGVALAVLAMGTSSVQAAFTYAVTVNGAQPFVFGQSTMTLTGASSSSTLSGTQIINLAQVNQTSTAPSTATNTANVPVNLTVAVTNTNSATTGSFNVLGTINVTRSDIAGAASTFTLTSILPPTLTLGGFLYTLGSPQYAAPTIQSSGTNNGSLSLTITETVPEPASLSLMGLGLGASVLVALRRRKLSS